MNQSDLLVRFVQARLPKMGCHRDHVRRLPSHVHLHRSPKQLLQRNDPDLKVSRGHLPASMLEYSDSNRVHLQLSRTSRRLLLRSSRSRHGGLPDHDVGHPRIYTGRAYIGTPSRYPAVYQGPVHLFIHAMILKWNDSYPCFFFKYPARFVPQICEYSARFVHEFCLFSQLTALSVSC